MTLRQGFAIGLGQNVIRGSGHQIQVG